MKGQFFIIATVIIVASLVAITQYFYDYSKTDLTDIYNVRELQYVQDVKYNLLETARISAMHGCESFSSDMTDAENVLKNKLLEKGIELIFTVNSKACPGSTGPYNLNYNFKIKSSDFESTTRFVV